MRTPKELMLATKAYAAENPLRSWIECCLTLFLLILFVSGTLFFSSIPLKVICSLLCSLLYVRMFIIYHDYQHNAILQNSSLARFIMVAFGIYMLTPQNIWKRSHDHHHNNNSKLTLSGIGSYPTIDKIQFLKLSQKDKRLYLINRHPLTIIMGYFTLFIYWLNIRSVMDSPKKHVDSAVALIFHVGVAIFLIVYFGWLTAFLTWFMPYFLSYAIGSYLFYSQHNFPGAQFMEHQDWSYSHSALSSTSYMVMPKIVQWLTGNIGYHHIHHLNSRIPFYRLPEVMEKMPELQQVKTTSWSPSNIIACFKLKLWDAENKKMISLKEL